MRIIIFLVVLLPSLSFAQEWEWLRQANGEQNDYTSAVFTDDSGYVYSTGRTKYGVTFSDPSLPVSPAHYGHTDAFITKYSSDGDLQWANLMGGDSPDWGWATYVDDSGYVYVTGEFSTTGNFGSESFASNGDRDVFVSKINPNGDFVWTKTFGGAFTDKGFAIVADKTGNVYVSGYIRGEVTIGTETLGVPTKFNAFFVKLSKNGDFLIFDTFESAYFSRGNDLVITDNQEIFICGEYTKTAIFDTITEPGISTSWPDAFLAKYDTSLAVQWVRTGVGPFYHTAFGVDYSDDYVYTTGYFSYTFDLGDTSIIYNASVAGTVAINDARDLYVAKYDYDGNFEWAKGFGYEGEEVGYAIDVTPQDNIYITGTFQDSVYFGDSLFRPEGSIDIITAKLDSEGEVLWAKQNGIDTIEYGYGIAVDENENVFVGGTNADGCVFDSFTLSTYAGNYDAFVGKITQRPNPSSELIGVPCYGDTIIISVNGITTPLSYEWNLVGSPTGFGDEGNFYIPVVDASTVISGYVVVSNNLYDDTLHIDEIFGAYTPTDFSLGLDTTLCDHILSYTIEGPSGGSYYNWSTGDEGPSISSIDVSTTDEYILDFTNPDGCVTSDTILVQFSDCLSLDESIQNDLKYYVENQVIVVTGSNSIDRINIYDLNGRLIEIAEVYDYHWVGNMSSFAHGTYVMSVISETGIIKNIKVVL
ncbi:MAG: hypothetical protein MK105_18450 [Crocinitomicaceae bacterium]|nr:hypothetical protein [Crocinitomicaceae bacterium]